MDRGNKGLDPVDESFAFDAIVYATGFDAMTRGPSSRSTSPGCAGGRLRTSGSAGPARDSLPQGQLMADGANVPGKPRVFLP